MLKFHKSGTEMSDQDSKILLELGEYLKIKTPHFVDTRCGCILSLRPSSLHKEK